MKEHLTFDGDVQGYPTSHALVIRDDSEVLVYAERSKNADAEWEIRKYRVLGDGISFRAGDLEQARVAAIFIEEFDPADLTINDRHRNQSPIKDGVPVTVAVDGEDAICAWLYVRGWELSEIGTAIDGSIRGVRNRLSRFRDRRTGIPEGLNVPAVGDTVPEVPAAFDPTTADNRIVSVAGATVSPGEDASGEQASFRQQEWSA